MRFYGAVFGWAFVDNPMGKTIMHRGVVIGGASAVKAGLDTHWTPYIACGDVDAAAARAVAAGGVVTTGEPADVPGIGRIAPMLDPEKSIFVAFAPIAGGGAPPYVPGRFVWERPREAEQGCAVGVEHLADACNGSSRSAAPPTSLCSGSARPAYALVRDPQRVPLAVHANR